MVVFTTPLAAMGGNNVAIEVPEEIVLGFGRGKRVPVVVTIDGGYTYRSTVAVMAGRYLISFNAETRKATGRVAGDEVEVTLEADDAPRTVAIPQPLANAFAQEASLADAWATLSYSRQKELATGVESAKTDATREKRIAAALDALR